MDKKPIIICIIMLFIVSTANATNIWFTSDSHVTIHPNWNYTWQRFYDAVNDTNTMNIDYAFVLGDCVFADGQFSSYAESSWNKFLFIFHELNTTYKNYAIGNHDSYYGIYGEYNNLYYTYEIGNILICVINDESTGWNSGTGGAGFYDDSLNWLNTTVQNNADKNIFVMSHYPIRCTTYYHPSDTETYIKNDDSYRGFLAFVENDSSCHIDAWIHGHRHYGQNISHGDMIVDKYGLVNFNIGSLATWAGNDEPHPIESTYWLFTEGSSEVIVQAYNHETNNFIGNGFNPYPYVFNLTYPFIENESYYTIDLSEGWNLIGILYNASVAKDDIVVCYNGTDYTWQDAVNNSIVLRFIYRWNAANQNYELTNMLQPCLGHWMYAYQDCILKIEE